MKWWCAYSMFFSLVFEWREENSRYHELCRICSVSSRHRWADLWVSPLPYIPHLIYRYWNRKNKMIECEQMLLRTLGFNVECDHPYFYQQALHPSRFIYMLNYSKSMNLPSEIVQIAFGILIDSYSTNLYFTFSPQVIAVTSIYIAIRLYPKSSVYIQMIWLSMV